MKKRVLAVLLCLVMVVGLLPVTAGAADLPSPNPAGTTIPEIVYGDTLNENRGTVITNHGTVTTNASSGNMMDNFGQVVTNNGSIGANRTGTVTTNNRNVSANFGTVITNHGTVNENGDAGFTVSTVQNNHGTVNTNYKSGIVQNNYGAVTTNNGAVINTFGGTITNGNPAQNNYHKVTVVGGAKADITGLTDANNEKWILDTIGQANPVTITPVQGEVFTSAPTISPAENGILTDNSNGTYSLHSVTGPVTLTIVPPSAVTLLKNGGAEDGAVEATYGAALPPFSALSRTGYTLSGYFTSANGGDMVIDASGALKTGVSGYTDASAMWKREGAVTLYAQWSATNYTVTYDTAGGSAIAAGSYNIETTSFTLPAAPTKTGYTFAGWKVTTGASGMGFAADTEFAADATSVALDDSYGHVTLTAQWTANEYTVGYDGNKPTAATETVTGLPASGQVCNYDIPFELAAAPTLTGYTFGGWYKDAGCADGDRAGSAGESVSNLNADSGATVILYAKWTAIPSTTTYYRLSFDTNGGGAISSISRATGGTVELSAYVPVREGYNFTGWYADEALTEAVTSLKLTKDVTVYAKWQKAGSMDNFTLSGEYAGFDDVDESKWYGTEQEGVIRDAVLLGIVEGYGNGKFGPEDSLKISEAIKMACVVYSTYYGDGFDFTEGDPWYDVYVDYALEKSLIKSDDFADYTAVCTRAEAAYIFSKALPVAELAKISELTPPDVAETDAYAAEIYLLYAAGILKGNDDEGAFAPDGAFTRAQAAAIITRLALPEKR